jgi:glycerol kinase
MQADAGFSIPVLRVDGGASVSDVLMQFQADISGLQVDRPAVTETTAFGAACLAGLSAGIWPDPAALQTIRKSERIFSPVMPADEQVERRLFWRHAIETTIRHGHAL